MRGNCFTVIFLALSLCPAVTCAAIQSDVDCDVKLYINDALVMFHSDATEPHVLQGRNSYCYKCAWSDIAEPGTCSVMFSPHEWHLRVIAADGTVVATKDYTFGEHGEYNVTFSSAGGALQVHEIKEGIDSMKPLNTFIGLLCAFVFLCFFVPYAYRQLGIKDFIFTSESSHNGIQECLLSEEDGQKHKEENETGTVAPRAVDTVSSAVPPKKKPARLHSLDTFRGLTLCLMIFVNYGGGGYWFFEHADWHGLTFADVLFPWFMWMMGVSMALSFEALAAKNVPTKTLWRKALRRTFILFWLGMFLANGYELKTWRIPGVLQYFSVSYFMVCATVLVCQPYTQAKITDILTSEKRDSDVLQNWTVHPEDRGIFGSLCYPRPSTVLSAYRMEWAIQLSLVVIYIAVTLGAKAPGCPRGYIGPGGIGDHGDHSDCTGGIHRYMDIMLFTDDLIFHAPTCKELYSCQSYDPEGFLGTLTASFLTYLGLMAGRVLIHFPSHRERLTRWAIWAISFMFLAGIFCGFSKNDGFLPINKNLWTTSFAFVTAGGGLVCLSVTYVLVDVLKVWTGAPFISMGMNSILIYVGHDILAGFFPFSYETDSGSHARVLQMNLIGTTCWVLIGVYMHRINFFVKV